MANKVTKSNTKALATAKEVQPKDQKVSTQTKQGKGPNNATKAKGAQSLKAPADKKNAKAKPVVESEEDEEESDDIEVNSDDDEVNQVATAESDNESGSEVVDDNEEEEDADEEEDEEEEAPTTLKRKFEGKEEQPKKFARNDASEKSAKVHKAFIGGLPFKATEDDITNFFEDCGGVETVEIVMQRDGRASGTAYVTFSSEQSLQKAIAKNGQELDSRWLKITEARSGDGEKRNGAAVAFVGNLPYDATQNDLTRLFSSCGKIKTIRIATHADTGNPRGFAHIEFEEESSVEKAKTLKDCDLNGRTLRVDSSEQRESSGSRGGRGGFGGGRDFGGRGGRGGGRGGSRGGRGGFRN